MNIVIVNDYAHINGGAARVALSSAKALAQRGHAVHVFAGVGPISDDLGHVRTRCLNAVPYHKRPSREGAKAGLNDVGARSAFEEFVRDLNPSETVVHFHTYRDALSPSVPTAALERGFAIVHTSHEYLLGCPYGAFFDQGLRVRCPERGSSLGCWMRPCNGGSRLKKLYKMVQAAEYHRRGIPARIRHFVFVSEFSRRILQSYLPKDANCTVVPNPVESLAEERVAPPADAPFLFVGNLHPGKNPLLLAQAARELGVRARFVGTGELEEELRRVNPDAELAGWLTESELRDAYRSARSLVFTPIWPETQGLAAYEAAANGVPLIVSEDCAAADFVREHQAGLLVKPNDLEGLKAAMSTDVAASGANAYQGFWSNPPTMDRHLEALLPVYDAALRGPRG